MRNVNEIYRILNNNKVAIYGAGYIGKRFYRALAEKNCEKNVDCFVTTAGNNEVIEGLQVRSIENIQPVDGRYIFVAVHESMKEEIFCLLKNRGFKNYVWITPLLYDVMLEAPIQVRMKVPLKKIWNAWRDNYSIAIRYMAAEEYYGRRKNGYEIYKKYYTLFNGEKTAEKRLQMFIKLLNNWDRHGYDETKPSILLDNYVCIDGTHRIAAAIYHGQEYVVCNIYPALKTIEEIHGEDAVLTRDGIKKVGLDDSVIEILDDTNRRIEIQFSRS